MEDKHPVSALQELMAQQHRMLPSYEIIDISEVGQPKFRCIVKADDIVGIGEASQKQAAKREAAVHALSQLRYTKTAYCGTNNSAPAVISYNAVGKLNEYTSKKRLPYATYNEYGQNVKGQFIIKCKLMENISEGIASTKKAAKQLAAHYMLNNLDEKNMNNVCRTTSPATDCRLDEHDKVVFEKFKKLSINVPTICKKAENIQKVCNDKLETENDKIQVQDMSTIEDMIEALQQYNISYNIDVIRRNPFVLLMRFGNENNTTVVETGTSYKETQKKLMRKALTVLSALKDIKHKV